MKELPNLATYTRYLWQEENLLVVAGEIAPVLEGYGVYNRRYGIPGPKPRVQPVLTKLLASAALAAVSLPERESWGWTLTIPDAALGFFVGIEPEGMICVQIQDVDRAHKPVVVQRQKPDQPIFQSHFQPHDRDPVATVQRYFEEVEQNVVRLAVDDKGKGVLAHVLPGGRFDRIAPLSDKAFMDLVLSRTKAGELKALADVLIFYECRCHDEFILEMIDRIPDARREELWGDLDRLEIACPRCDRKYIIRKNVS